MASVSYDHAPGNNVFIISSCGIISAVVVSVFINIAATTVVTYQVTDTKQQRLFATSPDVFSTLLEALNEYETRIQ